MTTGQIPSPDEDHVIWLKAPERTLCWDCFLKCRRCFSFIWKVWAELFLDLCNEGINPPERGIVQSYDVTDSRGQRQVRRQLTFAYVYKPLTLIHHEFELKLRTCLMIQRMVNERWLSERQASGRKHSLLKTDNQPEASEPACQQWASLSPLNGAGRRDYVETDHLK